MQRESNIGKSCTLFISEPELRRRYVEEAINRNLKACFILQKRPHVYWCCKNAEMICCLKNQLSENINFTSFQKPFKTHPNVCATLPNDVYKNCMHMGRVSSDKPQPLFNSFLSWKKTMNGLFCITINQSWFWWQQDSRLSRGNRKHQTTTMAQSTYMILAAIHSS